MGYSGNVSTLPTEARVPVLTRIPQGASARVVALPFGRFKLRVREGRLASSVGEALVQIEGRVLHLNARRPPRWSVVTGQVAPLGFVASAVLLVVGALSLGLAAAATTATIMALVAILRSLLAVHEETTVRAADAFVVAVKRPLGLERIDWLMKKLEKLLPRPLADLVGPRVVEVEASFGADRLAIQRRALVARRVVTAQSLVQALRAARHARLEV